MIIRDYQAEDVEKIFEEWKSVQSTLYVAATGLGKTIIMSEVVKRMLPKRAIMLAHRSELISQARNAFYKRGIDCEIEQADQVASTTLWNRQPVVLATVQTLLSGSVDQRRMKRFNPKDFSLLLYDESHRSVSVGNKSIVDYFIQGNPEIKVLGVTATPARADEKALGQIFQSVAAERDILWGISNGWLVPIEQLFVPVSGLDYSEIRTTAGDLNGADLSRVLENEENLHNMIQPTLEAVFGLPERALNNVPTAEWGDYLSVIERRKRTIVFTASVAQAEMMSNIFNRVIPTLSCWLCGKTDDHSRKLIFDDFGNGRSTILVNCGVTTEGYDNPFVELIVMARPTKSETLYRQMVGRGTRTFPGLIDGMLNASERVSAIADSAKPCVTVLDFVGNSGRHKLMSTTNILGGNFSEEVIELAERKAKEKGTRVNMTKELEDAEEELRRKIEEAREREESRKRRLVLKSKYTTQRISPFDALDIMPVRSRAWDSGRHLSEKQRSLLLKNGINADELPYSQGQQLIGEMFRRWNGHLCSVKQAALLKRFGYHTKEMSTQTASVLITKLKANGWKRIEEKNETILT